MSSNMIRVTGMNSGLDTESIISAYTSTASKRVQDAKNSLQINKWTQDAWKSLNSKIYSFYSNTLSSNRLSSAYAKTKVTTSSGALTVVGGENAVTGMQTAQIKSAASAAYLTGSEVNVSGANDSLNEALEIAEGSTITYTCNDGTEKTIQIGGSSSDSSVAVVKTMDELASALKKAGLNANFDSGNKRLFLSAKKTGETSDFSFSGDLETLAKLGIATDDQLAGISVPEGEELPYKAASKIDGTKAKLILNGAEFESDSNTFIINGSTYSINYLPTDTDENIAVTTSTDYDGVYKVVKDMLTEYNDLVNEMSKLYNAESSKGYDPLTEEQKDAMTESEIEDWENKIKDSLLRNDDTVFDVLNAMTNATGQGVMIKGKNIHLSDFGISTQGYFEADPNERYALHIDGDSEDAYSSGNADKLKSMIASDPEAVTSFFTQFAQNLYTGLYDKMGSTSLSSIYKVYNDKELKTEQGEWEKKIVELEDKLTDMEDKYYAKFARMETALAKLNSRQSSVSSFFG